MTDLSVAVKAVLTNLKERRNALTVQLRELDATIAGLQSQFETGIQVALPLAYESQPIAGTISQEPQSLLYRGISVRWAILWHLSELKAEHIRTIDLSHAIREGGYETKGDAFPNAVSAVISSMKNKTEPEVEPAGGGYRITAKGREVWEAIKRSHSFRSRAAA